LGVFAVSIFGSGVNSSDFEGLKDIVHQIDEELYIIRKQGLVGQGSEKIKNLEMKISEIGYKLHMVDDENTNLSQKVERLQERLQELEEREKERQLKKHCEVNSLDDDPQNTITIKYDNEIDEEVLVEYLHKEVEERVVK
jgi:septal ring factor EnvC (AmiA/AmiB activator)